MSQRHTTRKMISPVHAHVQVILFCFVPSLHSFDNYT